MSSTGPLVFTVPPVRPACSLPYAAGAPHPLAPAGVAASRPALAVKSGVTKVGMAWLTRLGNAAFGLK